MGRLADGDRAAAPAPGAGGAAQRSLAGSGRGDARALRHPVEPGLHDGPWPRRRPAGSVRFRAWLDRGHRRLHGGDRPAGAGDRRRRHGDGARDRGQARRVPARPAAVHASGDAGRRRRRGAGAGAHPVERPHDRGDQPRGGAGQRPVAVPDPAREPAAASARRDQPAERRAGRTGGPRQVALPVDDEPRDAQSAERHPRAAGAARPERPRRAAASAGRPGEAVRVSRCCRC